MAFTPPEDWFLDAPAAAGAPVPPTEERWPPDEWLGAPEAAPVPAGDLYDPERDQVTYPEFSPHGKRIGDTSELGSGPSYFDQARVLGGTLDPAPPTTGFLGHRGPPTAPAEVYRPEFAADAQAIPSGDVQRGAVAPGAPLPTDVPAPDAVSGGGGMPAPVPDYQSAVPAGLRAPMNRDDEAAFQSAMTDDAVEGDAQGELARLSQMTAPQRAADAARREILRRQQRDRALLKSAVDDRTSIEKSQRDVEDIFRVAKERTEAVRKHATELGQKTLDNNRWFSSQPAAAKAAFAVSGLLDGIFNYDQKNPTVEHVAHEQEKDVQRQKDDIANGWRGVEMEQGLVRDFVSQGMSLHEAGTASRIAMLQNTKDQILARAALYDPAGTLAQQMMSEAENAQALINKLARDHEVEDRKYRIDQYQAQTARKSANLGYAQLTYKKERDKEEDKLAREKMDNELEKERLKLKPAQAEKAKAETRDREQRLVVDSRSGKVVGVSRFNPDQNVKDSDAIEAYRSARDLQIAYAKQLEKVGRQYKGPGSDTEFWSTQDFKDTKALHERLVSAIATAQSGKAASDTERAKVMLTIPEPSGWLTRANPAETVREMQEYTDRAHRGFLVSRLIDDKGEPDVAAVNAYMKDVTSLDHPKPADETEVGKLSKEAQKPVEKNAWWIRDRGKSKDEERAAKEKAAGELGALAAKGDPDAAEALWNAFESGESAAIGPLYRITGVDHPSDLKVLLAQKKNGLWTLEESLPRVGIEYDQYGNQRYVQKPQEFPLGQSVPGEEDPLAPFHYGTPKQ